MKLENQIGMDIKGANRRVAKAMSIDEIEGTHLFKFFLKLKEACKANRDRQASK